MILLKSVPLIRVKLMVRTGLRLNYLPSPTLWMELRNNLIDLCAPLSCNKYLVVGWEAKNDTEANMLGHSFAQSKLCLVT